MEARGASNDAEARLGQIRPEIASLRQELKEAREERDRIQNTLCVARAEVDELRRNGVVTEGAVEDAKAKADCDLAAVAVENAELTAARDAAREEAAGLREELDHLRADRDARVVEV